MYSENKESYMFQVHGVEITEYQSKAIGIPQIRVKTSGLEEEELYPLIDTLMKLDIDGLVVGAQRSEYQRRRFDFVCEEVGIRSFSPLWHKTPTKILREMIEQGFEIMIVAIAAYGFDSSWLGRVLDNNSLQKLCELRDRYGINIDGEGGEFETAVLYGPTYKKRVVISDYDVVWRMHSGYIIPKKVDIVDA